MNENERRTAEIRSIFKALNPKQQESKPAPKKRAKKSGGEKK